MRCIKIKIRDYIFPSRIPVSYEFKIVKHKPGKTIVLINYKIILSSTDNFLENFSNSFSKIALVFYYAMVSNDLYCISKNKFHSIRIMYFYQDNGRNMSYKRTIVPLSDLLPIEHRSSSSSSIAEVMEPNQNIHLSPEVQNILF